MLKWTASTQKLHEATASLPTRKTARRQRRATIANKENIPFAGCTSTPMAPPARRSCHMTPLTSAAVVVPPPSTPMRSQSQYAATLPRYEEEYSPSAAATLLPSGHHLALRGLLPTLLDPFAQQPHYLAATAAAAAAAKTPKKRKLEQQFKAVAAQPPRAVTPQPSTHMGDQTLDKLIDAILDSACKADASSKKSRKSFNLRRRTLVKQQLESSCSAVLSPSYAPGDDPASDLSFALLPLPLLPTPEPALPLQLRRSVLLQLPTPSPPAPAAASAAPAAAPAASTERHSDTFSLETPVRPMKRRRSHTARRASQQTLPRRDSPQKRYKVDARNYFEVGLALPSSIYV